MNAGQRTSWKSLSELVTGGLFYKKNARISEKVLHTETKAYFLDLFAGESALAYLQAANNSSLLENCSRWIDHTPAARD